MGCCTGRCTLITICILQLVSTIERLVFDFLGYMWTPIITGFINLVCVILGIFGVYHYRPRYVGLYTVWMVLWLGWNVFVICLYLEVGILSLKENTDILNLNTGHTSWWKEHGIGCNTTLQVTESPSGEIESKPVAVTGCILDYRYVEVLHAAVQCLMALIGFMYSLYVICKFSHEDDSFDFIGGFDSYTSYHAPQKTSHMQLQPIYVHHGDT